MVRLSILFAFVFSLGLVVFWKADDAIAVMFQNQHPQNQLPPNRVCSPLLQVNDSGIYQRCLLRDACVSTKGYVLILPKGERDDIDIPLQVRCQEPTTCFMARFRSVTSLNESKREKLGVLLVPYWDHFGHHLLEGLFSGVLQLLYWNQSEVADPVFLIPQFSNDQQWLLVTNRSTRLPQAWTCFDTLLAGPGHVGIQYGSGNFDSGIFEKARDYIVRRNISRTIVPPGRRAASVLIQQGDWRQILELDRIIDLAATITGFPVNVVKMHTMSMVAQVNAVRNASIYIAVSASASANALWLRDGCVFLQIEPPGQSPLHYISETLKQVHWIRAGGHEFVETPGAPRIQDRHVKVNVTSVAQSLREAMRVLGRGSCI